MAVTATTVAAATTMLAAVAAVFLSLVLCFYIFLCAKRYRGGGAPPAGRGAAAWLRFFLWGGDGRGAAATSEAAWCYDGGLDDKSMAKLPCREVAKGEEAFDCAVCITELAAGETARVLPRCGHAFHVACVDMWLKSHSTCPLCRRPAVDDPPVPPPAVAAPEADPDSPNFPTNVLFFGSQDEVSTGRAAHHHQQLPASETTIAAAAAAAVAQSQSQSQSREEEDEEAAPVVGMRRLIPGCGGASPPPQPLHRHQHQHHQDAERDIEMGLAAGESLGR